jgi:2',3'-cyclic-nucleotide 2'-phosphodiesterase
MNQPSTVGNRHSPFWRFKRHAFPYVRAVRILFIADVVGQPGRRAVRDLLPGLRLRHGLELVIANGENAAGGSGITPATAEELFACGVDVLTSGDHLWDQKEVAQLLETERRFVRPGNYPPGTPGQGSVVVASRSGVPVAVVNAQGRTFMPPLENPFVWLDREVDRLREQTQVIVVDFHAEATSEKIAMGRMLDGRVTAVVGTHTHVQTADERLFPGGTAFLCDAGYTGPHESVLGRAIEPVLERFRTCRPQKFEVARDNVRLQGALIGVDPASGRALSIERVDERSAVVAGGAAAGRGPGTGGAGAGAGAGVGQ